MKVYRLTDRIPVSIGEITFWISPLSGFQKLDLIQFARSQGGDLEVKAVQLAAKAIKYAVKWVEGLSCFDGSPYELEFDQDGTLSNDCVDELLLLSFSPKLTEVATHLVTKDIEALDIEGVTIDLSKTKSVKKK